MLLTKALQIFRLLEELFPPEAEVRGSNPLGRANSKMSNPDAINISINTDVGSITSSLEPTFQLQYYCCENILSLGECDADFNGSRTDAFIELGF